jgi:NAD(P)H-flavin reductase/2-polyprenyl-6-methoxyphenol hydroxylase-like FAD-dependent oxidoreductase/ferredoxin
VRYSDGASKEISVEPNQSVLEAADAQGVPIVSACHSGICGTCVAHCTRGEYELGQSIGLSQAEKSQRRLLSCQAHVRTDCTIVLDYPLGRNAARIVSGMARVARIEQLSASSALLQLDVSTLAGELEFKAGQFAQLQVPGTECWRSYSFAHAPRTDATVEFLIRLLPSGAMSDYLRDRCREGDGIKIRGSKGEFYLRDSTRPIVLLAGGTGLSSILSLAEQLVREGGSRPIRLKYGVTRPEDLVLTDRLERLAAAHASFTWRAIVRESSPDWHGAVGDVTDLLEHEELNHGEVDAYLCGPPAMVEATRSWMARQGLHNASLYYEKFTASGGPGAGVAKSVAPAVFDPARVIQEGRGTAVVIGGSIAGIAAAKILAKTFSKVIVVEKDSDHRRSEGRPGAAQGWHLHHLLIAGQRLLESIFPGIIDDMVRAGAFKVDMGEQYRLMLAGAWKKAAPTGIDIVCAGRPLIEWCIRRRLDTEPAIEYRYDNEVKDVLFCKSSRAAIGIEIEHGGAREIIAAEFVVDASGKNTPVPAALRRAGFEAPMVEEDHISCFYSTMHHRVPAERAWRDRVMVICYAYRPQQRYYAAQYFTDSSRSVLSTTLVGYNCYEPPRNAEEFREFARRMPSPLIGDELDGLEASSPVYNFRYPTMQRHRYEDVKSLPSGLIALGDAYSSVDPVSGAGMSKAMLEVDVLRSLLRARVPRNHKFVRDYYRRVGDIEDLVWSVIREQNLRFPWIQDVERKRPAFFRARNWYVDRVFECMHEDPAVYRLYLAVAHFVAPPRALLRPDIAARVLGQWLMTRLRGRATLIERNFGPDYRNGSAATPGASPSSDR